VNKVEFMLHTLPLEVSGVGFGFVAMKAGVFEKIDRPWFGAESFVMENGMVVNYGEDYSWCVKAQRAGFKIWVDPAVRVGHNKEIVYRAD
jgi:GT2 family glycosyltransferase